MNVLIIGGGGREHALTWKISQSEKIENLFVCPGNAGTETIAQNIDISVLDTPAIKKFCVQNKIDMVIVGPEDPLANGIRDDFKSDKETEKILFIGPSKQAAKLESSKEYAKEFMHRYGIPTAKYLSVTQQNLAEGKDFLSTMAPPYVLKADGLAGGKGVLIIEDLLEAQQELEVMINDRKFGTASETVIIEEFLTGLEMSTFVITDGKCFVPLPNAKDYKRIGDGDRGLNTGGMGAVSPAMFADELFLKKIEEKIVKPTVLGLEKEGLDYKGFIFFGLIKVEDEPYVIEYNVRMGDPETEVVIPRITSDLVEVLEAVDKGELAGKKVSVTNRICSTVMMVSGGYPESYEKNKEILGLENLDGNNNIVFHAGTKLENGKLVTNGGRVMCVSTLGESLSETLEKSYSGVKKIHFEKVAYRKDIGQDLLSY